MPRRRWITALCLLSCREPAAVWTSAPALGHARAAHAVVATDDEILVFAGTGVGGAPVLQVERFDGAGWTDVASLPGAGLNAPAAAVVDERVYLIGGFNLDTNVPSDRVHVYTVATGAWTEAAPLPAPRGGHAAVVFDRTRIHVLGGGNDRSTIADHSVYDPQLNTWTARAPLPRAEGSPAAVVFDGKIYAIGGRSGPADFGAVDIYDPTTDTWTAGPAISPRGTAGAAIHCGAIHLFGGESQATSTSLDEVLRLADGVWRTAPAMPTARNFARAVTLRGAVYVVGGSQTPEPGHAAEGGATVERYQAPCAG